MTWPIDGVAPRTHFDFRTGRVSEEDAERQLRTVGELVRRLSAQPGVVLADEVGMGKTFAALGVAVLAALGDRGRRPVVVMVPSSLHEKWPRDFEVFSRLALKRDEDRVLRAKSAGSALEFFKLLDDPPSRRAHIIFLKHGAFHIQQIDHWVRLALIRRAMHGMHLGERRTALPRFAASLLRTKSSYRDPELFDRLLTVPYPRWMETINTHYVAQPDLWVGDHPVPEAVQKVLASPDLKLDQLRECLRALPARISESLDSRLEGVRRAVNEVLKEIWPRTIAQARFRSPLLILDEAHHLKNPATRLASLFVTPDAKEDADAIAGALDGAFERMLFLTATPFQLGHRELLNVIDRFRGIAWSTLTSYTAERFEAERAQLRDALDRAQHRAVGLDTRWQSVRMEDIRTGDEAEPEPEKWWGEAIRNFEGQPERVQVVLRAYEEAQKSLKEAEGLLRPWVLRHLRDRELPGLHTVRRLRWPGRAISQSHETNGRGLPVSGEALLPFLLAARAQAVVARDPSAGRATFAEGLASSYEAFLETRANPGRGELVDEEGTGAVPLQGRVNRYLEKLAKILPDQSAFARHPKIAAVVQRATDLWAQGEKLVVFCHYRQTGRALARHLSAAIEAKLWSDAARRLRLSPDKARKEVIAFGERFDADGGMRRYLDVELERRLGSFPRLSDAEKASIQDVVRRFIRTPVFIARSFDVRARSSDEVLQAAFATRDGSGVALSDKIDAFLRFIAVRCEPLERERYLEALHRVQPGARGERPLDDESVSQPGAGELMPNVRLANGGVRQETRQRLLLSFNTPFFPDILVASSVLAEGVDLHLNCRYVIHHDLSWNPSTLEQRTGRVDRMGAKAEWVGKPIEVFLPYVGETQDEKQYRVVMDRERWFQILMGEDYRTDDASTDAIAERVPLPLCAAEALAFDLSVRSS